MATRTRTMEDAGTASAVRSHIARLDATLRSQFGAAAPRLTHSASLKSGPHVTAECCECERVQRISQVAEGLVRSTAI